jgi:phage shock protein C
MSNDEVRMLRRSKSDRMLAGVCGGLAEYFKIDPVWFRLGFVLISLPGGLPGVLIYLACWIMIPEE